MCQPPVTVPALAAVASVRAEPERVAAQVVQAKPVVVVARQEPEQVQAAPAVARALALRRG
jgi:hypothetical protein